MTEKSAPPQPTPTTGPREPDPATRAPVPAQPATAGPPTLPAAPQQPSPEPSGPAPAPAGRRYGVIALRPESCTSCMICVRECPDWCIDLDSHQEVRAPEGRSPGRAGRTRTVNVLDRFTIDFGLCMYCGICVEVCPHEALFWGAEHGHGAPTQDALVHDERRLATWLRSVPEEQLRGDAS